MKAAVLCEQVPTSTDENRHVVTCSIYPLQHILVINYSYSDEELMC